ncbi:uncharacterized protein PHALS_08154 [Plasmopara halstedii]|uniref:Uncharacterized protein n=1 Tax=Plasmopara halstedii TaxID=4781 RepID=A0A0P1ABM5_PLAHL|nr:uncharacterized protein PHALS_08154 [Plasmopara halstedii]CEG38057.1 hypothetical protein PHALS_08154 [Plasmopara halstedii]|eukprot:XP_024574426.1 hypothetical protein PHALS_08154 [Plasmopara halstedii]
MRILLTYHGFSSISEKNSDDAERGKRGIRQDPEQPFHVLQPYQRLCFTPDTFHSA